MKKIIFIANVDTGQGMSGGSRIYTELAKNWCLSQEVTIFGSIGNRRLIKKLCSGNLRYFVTATYDPLQLESILEITLHTLRRTFGGLISVIKHRHEIMEADFVYSVSDFYPDLLPALLVKLLHPQTKWVAGYYLFAPKPFLKDSPYRGKRWLKGLLYYLSQLPSYLLVKAFADFVFVTSQPDVARFVTSRRGQSRIVVVQGGVDLAVSEKFFKTSPPIPLKKRSYEACFLGRFHYQKGVLELIDIWQIVCQTLVGAKLAIIGNGPLLAEMISKIKLLGLEKNIDVYGFLDGPPKFRIFKQSKIMVHPATYDSGGMAAAEGMAWKLPGVAFDLEALKTYYPRGMLKAKPRNLKSFANQVIKLLTHPKLYQQKSAEAYDLIKNVWDWRIRSEKILQALIKPTKS